MGQPLSLWLFANDADCRALTDHELTASSGISRSLLTVAEHQGKQSEAKQREIAWVARIRFSRVRRFSLRDAGSDRGHAKRCKVQGKAQCSFHFDPPMRGANCN